MLIAHVSDCHLRADGRPLKDEIDTRATLSACIAHLASLEPKPEAVLVTGDLAHTGRPEDYQTLRRAFEELEAPVYVVPGNRDDRENLRRAFGSWGYLPSAGEFLHYAVEDHPVFLIGLDTQREDSEDGELCAQRLKWLEARLAEEPDRPAIVFMHHPPIGHAAGFEGSGEMEEIIRRHPQVARVAGGHLHAQLAEPWGGTVASTAASVAFQIGPELAAGIALESAVKPQVCPIYRLRPDKRVIEHVNPVGVT